MSTCNSCEPPLAGGRKRRQIGKRNRTRKVKRGGGWWDDLKSKFTGSSNPSPYAGPSWWDSIKNKLSMSANPNQYYSPSLSAAPSASSSYMPQGAPTYGGRKSRRKSRNGGMHHCVYEGKRSRKSGGRSRSRSRSSSRSRS
jgi:hypothetical protein